MIDPSYFMSDCQRVNVSKKAQLIAKSSNFTTKEQVDLYGAIFRAFKGNDNEDELQQFVINAKQFKEKVKEVDPLVIESIVPGT